MELTTPLKEAMAVDQAFGKVPIVDIFRSWNGFLMNTNRGDWDEAYRKLVDTEGYVKIMAMDSKKDFKKVEELFDELKLWVNLSGPYHYKMANCFEIASKLLRELGAIGMSMVPVV